MVDFQHLELLTVLAEELHFGRTAARLFVSQATVSQQLQRLESEVGVRLVIRTSRHVELTPAGRVFLLEGSRAVAQLERAARLAREAAEHPSLRIASNYPAGRIFLLPLLERLRKQDPSIITLLRELGSEAQVGALQDGDIDIGLLFGPTAAEGIESEPLLEVPIVAIVRPGHPLADRGVLNFSDVLRYRYFTGYGEGTNAVEDEVLRAAAASGIRMRRSVGPADMSHLLLSVESSDAIGFASSVRGVQVRASGLRTLRIQSPEPILSLQVAWRQADHEPWIDIARSELRELARTRVGVA